MYADDLCLIGESAEDLQLALNCLQKFCDLNNLTVNAKKSKLVIFHKGRLPECKILFRDVELERVNEFTYLGITFSTQLSFSSHLQSLVTKANSRIGLLFSKLELQSMSLEVLLHATYCLFLDMAFQSGFQETFIYLLKI